MLPFDPHAAAAAFTPERLSELVVRYENALAPADEGKLAARLRALWESTTAPGNMTAKSWLHEGARLLGDLPLGIAHRAIDRAVLASDRGFTPSVGAIRGFAEPMLAELRRNAARLRAVQEIADGEAEAEPAAADPVPVPHEETQAILNRVWSSMSAHQVDQDASRPTRVEGSSGRTPRMPSRADYIAMGIAPEVLDKMEADDAAAAAARAAAASISDDDEDDGISVAA